MTTKIICPSCLSDNTEKLEGSSTVCYDCGVTFSVDCEFKPGDIVKIEGMFRDGELAEVVRQRGSLVNVKFIGEKTSYTYPSDCLKHYSHEEEEHKDDVYHPSHYNQGSIEVIDFIDDHKLGFYEGNIIKYVSRYKYKGGVQDLEKAKFYLDRLINLLLDREAN